MKQMEFLVMGIMVLISNLSFAMINSAPEKATLSGIITDKNTGELLPGVSVYLPDLKTGAISNVDGTYKLENLPRVKILVQVTYLGYKLIAEIIDLESTNTMDFALEESVSELNEIVVTGLSRSAEKNRTPTPILTIPPIVLLQNSATNMIDAISHEPGVSQVTTGSGISKPVIRGLGYNRIVTVIDGIRQEGQQWGDEHGIEVDEYAIHKVEILKGPASLTYGSDAMAGVINLFSAPTLPEGTVEGNVLANFQSNNGLIGYSANLAGNEKGFIWDVRYSNKMAHAYQNKYDGYILNSGFRERAGSGIFGFNRSWGYSHLHISAYHLTPGIVEGDRDSATGKFLKSIVRNDSIEDVAPGTYADYRSYTPLTPYQEVRHYKTVLNNSFVLWDGSLKATIGWQQNQRQEFADILKEGRYGLFFLLNTVNYDLRYLFGDKEDIDLSLGVNGMQQSSQNKGTEFLIPEYELFDIGMFAIAKKAFGQLNISAGLRYDSRTEKGKDLYVDAEGEKTDPGDPDAFHQFSASNSTFTGVSGSLGATYQFSEHLFTKLNISRGFRAPNIAEISSNGVHEGTINFIIGTPSLKAEKSLQGDFAIGLNTHHVSAELDLFSNHILNYMFLRKLESFSGGDSLSDGYRTFKYAAGDAIASGGEFSIDIHPHPLDWLHVENSFSYVLTRQKNQPDSTKYLPFMPAPRFITELKATAKKIGTFLSNSYFSFEVENELRQDKFYAAFGTESATPGYTLFNLGIGTDVRSRKAILCSVYFNVNNLTDVTYQSHLNRLKYAPVNLLTGRTGIYNMGRNFSIKFLVPLALKDGH